MSPNSQSVLLHLNYYSTTYVRTFSNARGFYTMKHKQTWLIMQDSRRRCMVRGEEIKEILISI